MDWYFSNVNTSRRIKLLRVANAHWEAILHFYACGITTLLGSILTNVKKVWLLLIIVPWLFALEDSMNIFDKLIEMEAWSIRFYFHPYCAVCDSLPQPRISNIMMTSSKWKHFPRHWPFVWEIHLSPVNSPHEGQWRGALIFSLICAWINGWVNNREAGDLRRHRAHLDVIVMVTSKNKLRSWSIQPAKSATGLVHG